MTIFVNTMLILLAFAIVSLIGFKYIYPLFFINKWDRKYAKIIVQKKSFTETMEKFSFVTKEKFKEEKNKLRKEKLNKLNKL